MGSFLKSTQDSIMKTIQIVLLATFAASLSANGYTGELTCNLCIDIVKAVEDFLEDGHNQEDIIAIAEAFCEALDSKILQITSKEFVDISLPGIIDALVKGNPPRQVCEQLGICKWFNVITQLEGDRKGSKMLRMMPEDLSVKMFGEGETGQLWKIEPNGCLRNKELNTSCHALADEGDTLIYMKEETGKDDQHWSYTDDNYLESKIKVGNGLGKECLVLDVLWDDNEKMDIDGASVRGRHKDNTTSQKWSMIAAKESNYINLN